MSHKNTKPRCSDPYRESSGRWRVVTRGNKGEEGRRSFATEAEAWTYVRDTRAVIEARTRTTEVVLTDFLAYKKAEGLKQSTLDTWTHRLNGFFAPLFDLPFCDFNATHGKDLYATYREGSAVATHHGALAYAKSFFVWCVKEKLIDANPLQEIEAIGKPHRGKAQLHLDEARRLQDVAVTAYLCEQDEGGLVVLIALMLGLRTGEIVRLKGRDIDDNGKLLWVGELCEDDTKTESSVRRIEVPDDLAVLLKRQAKGKASEANLFIRTGDRYVNYCTQRLCKRAGVRVITGQGLRGTHATFAVGAGTSGHIVAQTLGHSSFQMTRSGHYATKGSVQSGTAAQVVSLLQRTQTTPRPNEESVSDRDIDVQVGCSGEK